LTPARNFVAWRRVAAFHASAKPVTVARSWIRIDADTSHWSPQSAWIPTRYSSQGSRLTKIADSIMPPKMPTNW
jgi:hypothetical protein